LYIVEFLSIGPCVPDYGDRTSLSLILRERRLSFLFYSDHDCSLPWRLVCGGQSQLIRFIPLHLQLVGYNNFYSLDQICPLPPAQQGHLHSSGKPGVSSDLFKVPLTINVLLFIVVPIQFNNDNERQPFNNMPTRTRQPEKRVHQSEGYLRTKGCDLFSQIIQ